MDALRSLLPTLESALAQSLLQALWSSALLGLAAFVVLAALARASAAARHAAGLGFLLAMVAVPAWHFVSLLASGAPVAGASAGLPSPFAGGAVTVVAGSAALPSAWLAGAWAAGVLVMSLRLAGGLWLVRVLAHVPAAPLPAAWEDRADAIRRALGIVRPVAIRVLDSIAQPFAARVLRPVIWLPAALLTRLAPAQLEALIAHELAHVRRLDWLWNGLQCAIEALLFFHPAVWLLGRRVREEREHACDDLAAAVCGDTVVVAEALAALATMARQRPLPRLVLAAGGGSLRGRVARLVGAEPAAGMRWPMAAAAIAIVAAGGLLAARASVAAQPPAVPAAPLAPSAAEPADAADADPWWTTVGDSIHMRIREDGHVRDYHVWTDADGKHEKYRVDGKPQPIDAAVHRWVEAHHAVPPVPPVPPADGSTALPPVPELPPLPPLPPAPPELHDLPAFKALVEQLGADAALVARLGSPLVVHEDCGPCRIRDDQVSLTLTVNGPKGAAGVHAVGRRVGNAWHYDRIELESRPVSMLKEIFAITR